MRLHTTGIDLGKNLFHLVGLNQRGEVVVRRSFSARNCCTSKRTCRWN
jgi:transposase